MRGPLLGMMRDGLPPWYTSVRVARRDPNDDGTDGLLNDASVAPRGMPRYVFIGLWGLGELAWEMVTGGTTDVLDFAAWGDKATSGPVRV